jgi:hypothetical protein
MSEKPLDIFSTRADRFPEAEGGDVAYKAIEKAIDSVPILGPITTTVLSQFLAPALERRREEWLKELAKAIDGLESRGGSINLKTLASNEEFISSTIHATRIAVSTHLQEKRDMLRNALMNVAIGNAPSDELVTQIYWKAIEDLSTDHIKLLRLLWIGDRDTLPTKQEELAYYAQMGYGKYGFRELLPTQCPSLARSPALLRLAMDDLRALGFIKPDASWSPNPSRSVSESDRVAKDASFRNTATQLGAGFVRFIADSDSRTPTTERNLQH